MRSSTKKTETETETRPVPVVSPTPSYMQANEAAHEMSHNYKLLDASQSFYGRGMSPLRESSQII